MDLIKGVVGAISAKEIPEDRFGNTYRLSIKVGDDWIGLGSGKKPDIGVKEGDTWVTLSKGDEIALVVEENNGYLNGQKKTLKITKKSGASGITTQSSPSTKAPAQSPMKASTSNGNGVDWAAKDAGAAASASIDKALAWYAISGTAADLNSILNKARDFQGLVKVLAREILNPPQKEEDKPAAPLTSGMPGKTTQTRTRKPAPVEPDEGEFVDDTDLF